MDLREFLTVCVPTWARPTIDPKGFAGLETSTPIKPSEYLSFAEKDFRLGSTRGLVNSLTNSKRAIDCEIFNVLSALSIPEPYSFPARLEKLQSLGLLAPRLIRRVVQLRNLLEHQYHKPSASEVEDALDIAAMFMETLKPYFAGSSYMESAWLADQGSTNPRGEIVKTKTHTMWRHDSDPEFTFARGIYVDSELGSKQVILSLVHENIEVGVQLLEPKDAGYIEVQAFLLRAQIEGNIYGRTGAMRFLKILRAAAP